MFPRFPVGVWPISGGREGGTVSAPKLYTERDIVLAKRLGCERERLIFLRSCGGSANGDAREARAYAAHEYPLPKIVRPRVVRDLSIDTSREFRVIGERFEARNFTEPGGEWTISAFGGWCLDVHVVRLFADLLASPTEEIDDDGSAPHHGRDANG